MYFIDSNAGVLYTPAFEFLEIFWPDDGLQAEISRQYLN